MSERKHPYSKENFLKRKELGDKIEAYATQRLVDAGIDAYQPKMEDGLATIEYTKHQIDIIANERILEVKGRNVNFESVETFPYPTIFVEGVNGFEQKVKRPDFYINVSHKTGAIIALDVAATYDKWIKQRTRDNDRNFSFNMYISETKDWMNFDQLVVRLNESV